MYGVWVDLGGRLAPLSSPEARRFYERAMSEGRPVSGVIPSSGAEVWLAPDAPPVGAGLPEVVSRLGHAVRARCEAFGVDPEDVVVSPDDQAALAAALGGALDEIRERVRVRKGFLASKAFLGFLGPFGLTHVGEGMSVLLRALTASDPRWLVRPGESGDLLFGEVDPSSFTDKLTRIVVECGDPVVARVWVKGRVPEDRLDRVWELAAADPWVYAGAVGNDFLPEAFRSRLVERFLSDWIPAVTSESLAATGKLRGLRPSQYGMLLEAAGETGGFPFVVKTLYALAGNPDCPPDLLVPAIREALASADEPPFDAHVFEMLRRFAERPSLPARVSRWMWGLVKRNPTALGLVADRILGSADTPVDVLLDAVELCRQPNPREDPAWRARWSQKVSDWSFLVFSSPVWESCQESLVDRMRGLPDRFDVKAGALLGALSNDRLRPDVVKSVLRETVDFVHRRFHTEDVMTCAIRALLSRPEAGVGTVNEVASEFPPPHGSVRMWARSFVTAMRDSGSPAADLLRSVTDELRRRLGSEEFQRFVDACERATEPEDLCGLVERLTGVALRPGDLAPGFPEWDGVLPPALVAYLATFSR